VYKNIHNMKIYISVIGSGMLNTINIMDSGAKFRLNKKILKTTDSMGNSADEASGICVTKEPSQSNRIVVQAEVRLSISDAERARQYQIR